MVWEFKYGFVILFQNDASTKLFAVLGLHIFDERGFSIIDEGSYFLCAELYSANISELQPVALFIRTLDDLVYDDEVLLLTFWHLSWGIFS